MVLLSRALLVTSVLLGCSVVPNPDYGAAESGGSSTEAGTGSEGDATTAEATEDTGPRGEGDGEPHGTGSDAEEDDDAEDDGPAPPEDASCQDDAPSTAESCPPECDACSAGVCIIACDGEKACAEAEIACPQGLGCLVQCVGKRACQAASMACPPHGGCQLACEGEEACADLDLYCSGGTCELDCGPGKDPCRKVRMRCGTRSSIASCDARQPELELEPFPGSACACETLDACRGE